MRIKIVVATREKEENFFKHTALGQSLKYSMPSFVDVRLFSENSMGLPFLYNIAIEECNNSPATLIFVHDDLYFMDYYWSARVLEGLRAFDILGLVGNIRRLSKQPAWCFSDHRLTWDDDQFLSGIIAHGKTFPPENLSYYGETCKRVKLLDGVFIAANSQSLIENQLFFDCQFDFHFYDLDFCRQAEAKGLICGTWDIACQHLSSGAFKSKLWWAAYDKYLKKWGD